MTKVSLPEGNSSIGMDFINDIGSGGLRLKFIFIKVRNEDLLTGLPIEVATPGVFVEEVTK